MTPPGQYGSRPEYVRHGKHKWMLTLTIGATCMTFGFIMRIACHFQPYSLGLYIISTLFILLSVSGKVRLQGPIAGLHLQRHIQRERESAKERH